MSESPIGTQAFHPLFFYNYFSKLSKIIVDKGKSFG